MTLECLKVGIAGYGVVGKKSKNILDNIPGVEVVAISDINKDTWDLTPNNPNVEDTTDKRTPAEILAEIEFLDKKKKRVPYDIAVKVVKKYMGYRKSNEKGQFQAKIAKSYRDMLKALKEDYKPQTTILDRIDVKIQERKNG